MTLWSAFAGAVLWALAAPIVGLGVARLPVERRIEALVQGLFLSVVTGVVVLAPLALASGPLRWNRFVLLAGVMTFPVATLLYYLTAHAFTGKAELASQFGRVKPLFSIVLAVAVLHESLSVPTVVSALLVLAGVLILGVGAARGHFTWLSVWLGLATAGAWSLGELFVGLGFPKGGGVAETWMSLVAAAVVMALPALVAFRHRPAERADARWLWPFAAHGAVSFALAYHAVLLLDRRERDDAHRRRHRLLAGTRDGARGGHRDPAGRALRSARDRVARRCTAARGEPHPAAVLAASDYQRMKTAVPTLTRS